MIFLYKNYLTPALFFLLRSVCFIILRFPVLFILYGEFIYCVWCDCFTQEYSEEFRDISGKGRKAAATIPEGAITLIHQRPVSDDTIPASAAVMMTFSTRC